MMFFIPPLPRQRLQPKKNSKLKKTTFMDMEEQNATLFRLSLTLVYILLSPREN